MDGGALYSTVHGVAKSWTQLSDFTLYLWDFPGDPVVKTLPSNARSTDSIPGWVTRVPHAV